MNPIHPNFETLNDFVDGLLDRERSEGVERHLATCFECSREVESIRSLLESVATLPAGIAPPAWLWDEVGARTYARGAVTRRLLRHARFQLAAAAVLFLFLGSASTWLLLSPSTGDSRPPLAGGGPAPLEGVLLASHLVETEYAGAAEELYRLFLTRRNELSPETAVVVEQNLRIIDQAIETARAALLADPSNPQLPHLLASSYRTKIEVLERTIRLSQT